MSDPYEWFDPFAARESEARAWSAAARARDEGVEYATRLVAEPLFKHRLEVSVSHLAENTVRGIASQIVVRSAFNFRYRPDAPLESMEFETRMVEPFRYVVGAVTDR
jgi:hypothetical protein